MRLYQQFWGRSESEPLTSEIASEESILALSQKAYGDEVVSTAHQFRALLNILPRPQSVFSKNKKKQKMRIDYMLTAFTSLLSYSVALRVIHQRYHSHVKSVSFIESTRVLGACNNFQIN